ncbi:hypothetical protein [Kutzneria chonburiensis]|uniref:Uncharacterized protein n=1 Tax=Kutzneria chonburiensis TaxID=1483604 RepID=A0ABV6N493_9PSEU|nr:hypothetical protein [Kutzneria chonburiensis]
MTPEQAKELRKPFPANVIGKLPRVTCRACAHAQGRVCGNHRKARCGVCASFITSAHIHLDYVGHAEVTDRLLAVDPEWTWEPLALDAHGLPLFDGNGGLWIRLTIAGVTRIGYGAADGKSGPDAVKEAIGDGIRNSGMRFGVALDLWGASGAGAGEPADEAADPLADTDEAATLRASIATEATAKGYALDDVEAVFARSMNTDIRAASPAVLAEFLAAVRGWKPAEGAA